jgi:hypothetical protein
LELDSKNFYVGNFNAGPISVLPRDNPTLPQSLGSVTNSCAIAVGSERVFFGSCSPSSMGARASVGILEVASGAYETFVTNDAGNYVSDIAIDDQSLYVPGGNRIDRRPLAGGPAVPVTDVRDVAALRVDGEWLYFAERSPRSSMTPIGEIVRVSRTGGQRKVVVSGVESPVRIAIDDRYVYWTEWYRGTLNRAPKE